MKYLIAIKNIVYYTFLICMLLIAATVFLSTVKSVAFYKSFVVQSGSMEPTIKTGSVVFVHPQNTYKKGDIITFFPYKETSSVSLKDTVTHRITEVIDDKDGLRFKTKGDANNAEDQGTVSLNKVLGTVVLTVPYLGYPVSFAQTQMGFVLLIVIPATLIVYSELMNIKKEVKKMVKNRKQRKDIRNDEI